ncbi:MAG: CoB--CoM heterodisulfide reductase iron-sulfur subunit B family protein [Deltaproteobacteria bacterium]|nr:CoB--CoM heterodisulfide reductase iron-sulfur subunit B family protein [Deltaproteobacteria bacterium]
MDNIGYYPGCSLLGTAKEYEQSIRHVFSKLGINLIEVDDWSCCGATSAHATNHLLSVALPMRNIILAKKQGLKSLFIPCAACYNRFVVARYEIENRPELRKKIEDVLEEKIETDIEILNMIEMFQRIDRELFLSKRQRDLKGLKVAAYYGCLLVRPNGVTGFDDPEMPSAMEDVVRLTGAETVDWNFKVECCGASHSITNMTVVTTLSKRIIDDAVENGAEAIIVACPMCHSNLDMRQRNIAKMDSQHKSIPIFYLSELVGFSMGIDKEDLGLSLHFIDTESVLARFSTAIVAKE